MKLFAMLDQLVGDIDEQILDEIIVDSFNWLIEVYGDKSLKLNNVNRRSSNFNRHFSKKKQLILKWSYRKKDLTLKRDYLAAMIWGINEIHLHCNKRHTLQYLLEILFHEYKHSQQSVRLYTYWSTVAKVNYYEHPLEREANEFAEKTLPVYWQENSWKFQS